MFCPNCGSEYIEGYKICSDCNIALVDEIQEENNICYGIYCIKTVKAIISVLWKRILSIIKSKTYLRISGSSYKLYILSLFIFNFLTIRYISLWVAGPGWEIPVNLVGPINFIRFCLKINILLCIMSFIVGYRRFRLQRITSKMISIFWIIGSICLAFVSSDFIKLPKSCVNLIINYWWVGILFPFLLLSLLMYTNSIIRDNSDFYK